MYGLTYLDVWALLAYDSDSGLFTWKPREGKPKFNSRFAGKQALAAYTQWGYRQGLINYRRVLAHRVAYFMGTGIAPQHEIDHINGVRDDNRLQNLREATPAINRRNACLRSDNTTGVPGLIWRERNKNWQASFTHNYKQTYVGTFATKEEAEAAIKIHRAQHGFHENHGRPPRVKA
jgi:hypothetical protein